MDHRTLEISLLLLGIIGGVRQPSWAQVAQPTSSAPATIAGLAGTQRPVHGPDSLSILFDPGSALIRRDQQATLDQASRLYREGNPILMLIAGGTDTTGAPDENLRLSEARANTVLRELVARGIPVERFQVLGKGETDPAVQTPKGVADARNRRVEITWR